LVDPLKLVKEIQGLQEAGRREGYDVTPENFGVSGRCHVILEPHLERDRRTHKGLKKDEGSTTSGIAQVSMDKYGRKGIRFSDFLSKTFEDVLPEFLEWQKTYGVEYTPTQILEMYKESREFLRPFEVNDFDLRLRFKNKRQLFESSQAMPIGIEYASFYSGASSTEPGIVPARTTFRIGILKLMPTRVGPAKNEPVITAIGGELEEELRRLGHEYGATTGRERRCCWFDAVPVRTTAELGYIDAMFMNKVDVLDGVEKVKICVGYELPDGRILDTVPMDRGVYSQCKPKYIELPGWKTSTKGLTDFRKAPDELMRYLEEISNHIGRQIVYVGTGAKRGEGFVLNRELYGEIFNPHPLQF
jgi:adenylosuccinate synthase